LPSVGNQYLRASVRSKEKFCLPKQFCGRIDENRSILVPSSFAHSWTNDPKIGPLSASFKSPASCFPLKKSKHPSLATYIALFPKVGQHFEKFTKQCFCYLCEILASVYNKGLSFFQLIGSQTLMATKASDDDYNK